MQQHEKRIVALSVAVTLLGGWVTIGEAEVVRGPSCESEWLVFGSGSCPNEEGRRIICNQSLPAGCTRSAQFCGNAAGESNGYTLYCVVTES